MQSDTGLPCLFSNKEHEQEVVMGRESKEEN